MTKPEFCIVDTSRFEQANGYKPARGAHRFCSGVPGTGWSFEDKDGNLIASYEGLLATCQHAASLDALANGIGRIYVRP